jgi:hypothetical protein
VSFLDLLRVVGSPFTESAYTVPGEAVHGLYELARRNRMGLLFLTALGESGVPASLEKERASIIEKSEETIRLIKRVALILEDADLNYSFFKSIRPYPYTTVDLDIIAFDGDVESFGKAFTAAGFITLDEGPLSTTFRDPESGIGIDIYDEIGVSKIIYLDKRNLRRHVVDVVVGGGMVKALDPASDLLAVVSHSVLKELMYVLSEYYTTIYTLEAMTAREMRSLVNLSVRNRLSSALSLHLGVSASLHRMAHGVVPDKLYYLLSLFGGDQVAERLNLSDLPMKYPPLTIGEAFIEKLSEPRLRWSIAQQLRYLLNPSSFLSFIPKLYHQLTRETY